MPMLEAETAEPAAPSADFQPGKYKVTEITVRTSDPSKPPTELFIIAPISKGTYPVLLFCHGFMLANTNYTNMLQHIASHGYIVVAPKFYGQMLISILKEVEKAEQVTQWLSTGLPLVLPEKVNGNLEKLALSGHSRGGKTAFALALRKVDQKSRKKKGPTRDNTTTPIKFKALIGIDPVAGPSPSCLCIPKILRYIPRNFDMFVPALVIGSGYGSQSLGLIPAVAPHGVNHSEFFNECKPPVCYFLARDYGHCDMMDDKLDLTASFIRSICKSGTGPRDLMRKGVGGLVVSFLKAYLGGGGGGEEDLDAIVEDPSIAPVTLDPVIYLKE